jgi:hypothetical protein
MAIEGERGAKKLNLTLEHAALGVHYEFFRKRR